MEQLCKTVWVASYPRSGNTFIRTILWNCFGLRSGSIYINDLGGNHHLAQFAGHIEQSRGGSIEFPAGNLPLVKTHQHPIDSDPAIYVLRDGRAACTSLWDFRQRQIPLESIIEGKTQFGSWSDHVKAWHPWNRAGTLMIKYEDITDGLEKILIQLSTFLGRRILSDNIPDRSSIAGIDGRWVRKASDWKSEIRGPLLERFYDINGEMLRKTGYRD